MREAMEHAQRQQKYVRIKTIDLLKVLKANREKHVEEYQAAVEGWHAAYLEALEKAFTWLEEHKTLAHQGLEFEVIKYGSISSLMPERPTCHVDVYDSAITRYEYSADEDQYVELNDFECLVRDNWGWKVAHRRLSAEYTTKA